jgi:multiple sugar transport system substrate-binding protein
MATSELIRLKGMTWDHPRATDGLAAVAPYLADSLGVTIEWTARSLLAFGDQHIHEFAPDFDLMIVDHPHITDAISAGAIACLSDHAPADQLAQLERESVGESFESYRVDRRLWGLPLDAAAQVSAFRPDLRPEGVPPFWSDVVQDAKSGGVLWGFKPVDAFSTFMTLLAQKGALTAHQPVVFDAETVTDVLETLVELASLMPAWCQTANPIDVAEALVEGEGWQYSPALFGYTNYSRDNFRPRLLVYDDIPSFDGRATGSTLGGAGVAVSASTQYLDVAVRVAVALAGAELQSGEYTLGGGQPANLRAWLNHTNNTVTHQFFRNTLRTLEGAWVRPRVLGWPPFQLELSHLVHAMLVDKKVSSLAVADIVALPERHFGSRADLV